VVAIPSSLEPLPCGVEPAVATRRLVREQALGYLWRAFQFYGWYVGVSLTAGAALILMTWVGLSLRDWWRKRKA
jgi:hypothetical protein